MVRKALFVRIDGEIYLRAKHFSINEYGNAKSMYKLVEEALRYYLTFRQQTSISSKDCKKTTQNRLDYIIQFLRDPEKAQAQYKLNELYQVIERLLGIRDKRTSVKYLKLLKEYNVIDFSPYTPAVLINKVYPLNYQENKT